MQRRRGRIDCALHSPSGQRIAGNNAFRAFGAPLRPKMVQLANPLSPLSETSCLRQVDAASPARGIPNRGKCAFIPAASRARAHQASSAPRALRTRVLERYTRRNHVSTPPFLPRMRPQRNSCLTFPSRRTAKPPQETGTVDTYRRSALAYHVTPGMSTLV